jgi:predicted phosphodiesterase
MTSYRLALIADIHGTLPPLEKVFEILDADPPDQIMVAGDFLGGPQPHKTLAYLQHKGCQFILGNGETNMLKMHRGSAPKAWFTHHQFDLAQWIYNQLDEADFRFLESLPEQIAVRPPGCAPVRVVHGTPWDINKLLFPHKEPKALTRALTMISESVMVFAHTHLPEILYHKGKLALNPGSISNNLNGDTRASYATLTWDGESWSPDLHFVTYDLMKVKEIFIKTGFLEHTRPLGRGFLESILTGENTAFNFILYTLQKTQEAGYPNPNVVPDAIWFEAEKHYPWKLDL